MAVRYYVNPQDSAADLKPYVDGFDPVVRQMSGTAIQDDRVPRGMVLTVIDGGEEEEQLCLASTTP